MSMLIEEKRFFLTRKPTLMKFTLSSLLLQESTYLLQDLPFLASNTRLLKFVAVLQYI